MGMSKEMTSQRKAIMMSEVLILEIKSKLLSKILFLEGTTSSSTDMKVILWLVLRLNTDKLVNLKRSCYISCIFIYKENICGTFMNIDYIICWTIFHKYIQHCMKDTFSQKDGSANITIKVTSVNL